MTDMYSIYNTLTDIMCSRCSKEVSRECGNLPEEQRCRNRIYCMKMILEPNDEKYPAKLPKAKEVERFRK